MELHFPFSGLDSADRKTIKPHTADHKCQRLGVASVPPALTLIFLVSASVKPRQPPCLIFKDAKTETEKSNPFPCNANKGLDSAYNKHLCYFFK